MNFQYIIIQTFVNIYSLFLNNYYTIENNLRFEALKKELPGLKSRPGTSEEHQADAKKDKENPQLWRGNTMRDSVKCDECGFVRCIFSWYVKGLVC